MYVTHWQQIQVEKTTYQVKLAPIYLIPEPFDLRTNLFTSWTCPFMLCLSPLHSPTPLTSDPIPLISGLTLFCHAWTLCTHPHILLLTINLISDPIPLTLPISPFHPANLLISHLVSLISDPTLINATYESFTLSHKYVKLVTLTW